MASIPTFKLNTGAHLPAIGLGCWMGKRAEEEENKETEEMIKLALKVWMTLRRSCEMMLTDLALVFKQVGYRAFDTASGYGNEEAVGKAIRESGIPRDQIFVTTKVALDYSDVAGAFEASLQKLGLDYIDLWLQHWPQSVDPATFKVNSRETSPTFEKVWGDMEKVFAAGKVKAIGVSNYSVKNLEALLKVAKVVPAVNQVEAHPYLPQNELRAYCAEKGIHVTAYCPLGQYNSPILADSKILEIAKAHSVTAGQIILSWEVQSNLRVVPKSSNEGRLKQNLQLVPLSNSELDQISKLHTETGKYKSLCSYKGIAPEKGKVFGWRIDEDLGWDPKAYEAYY